jgi:hypothetical protein
MVLDPRTGLFNDQHRWYDACTSVFVSMDPIGADENLYRYCLNDPLAETDPTGLDGTYPFTVGGYKAKIIWSEGAWWSIGAGYWGQPSIRSGGGVNKLSNGLATTASVWGHYTCNTIIGSFAGNSGVMRASVELCPGSYVIDWSYSVNGFAASTLDSSGTYGPVGIGSFSITVMGKDLPGADGHGTFGEGGKPSLRVSKPMQTSIKVTKGGWIEFAKYSPTVRIPYGPNNSEDNNISTFTTIYGVVTILGIRKVR